jgi:hypothetical protein
MVKAKSEISEALNGQFEIHFRSLSRRADSRNLNLPNSLRSYLYFYLHIDSSADNSTEILTKHLKEVFLAYAEDQCNISEMPDAKAILSPDSHRWHLNSGLAKIRSDSRSKAISFSHYTNAIVQMLDLVLFHLMTWEKQSAHNVVSWEARVDIVRRAHQTFEGVATATSTYSSFFAAGFQFVTQDEW